MEKLKMHSPDLTQDNIARIRELLPGCVTEAKAEDGSMKLAVDFDQLRQELSDSIVEGTQERYHLNWPGKREALLTANAPIAKTLRPVRTWTNEKGEEFDESVNFDTTKNLFIEGDNLDALKLLQETYLGKVKLIYIDPPYNTGKDFVYPDNFQDNIKNYLELTGQVESGRKVSSNTEASGRFHTDWLNMVYPRLKIARNLLRQDGLVFISINDKELNNLVAACNEIFGEENFVATLVWEKGRKNDARRFSIGHEYLVGFAKDLSHIEELLPPWREAKEGVAEIVEEYLRLKSIHGSAYKEISAGLIDFYRSLEDDDPSKKYSRSRFVDTRGIWRDNNISWPGGGGPTYRLDHPVSGEPCRIPDDGWRFVEETMKRKIEDGYVEFREDHTKSPFLKSYLYIDDPSAGSVEDSAGEKLQVMGSVFYRHSQPSNDVMKDILGEKIFDNPKDHMILARIFRRCAGQNDLIVDFFAGPGSSGHAVWELNNNDHGKRRFILVQLPEILSPEKSEQKTAAAFCANLNRDLTVSEITKERLRRAGPAPTIRATSLSRGG